MAQPDLGYGNAAQKGQSHALHRPTRDQVLPLHGIRLSSPHQPPLAKLHEAPSARPLGHRTRAKGTDAGGGGREWLDFIWKITIADEYDHRDEQLDTLENEFLGRKRQESSLNVVR